MTGAEFVRKARKTGKRQGIIVCFAARRGKGSHGTLYFVKRFTIVQNLRSELPAGTLAAMLGQLGLEKKDLV